MKKILLCITACLFCLSQRAIAGSAGRLTVVQTTMGNASIPAGAQRVDVLLLRLSASCDAVVHIRRIVVHHTGQGSIGDIAKIYATEAKTRLTRGTVFHSPASLATIRFSPSLTLQKCESRTITVAVDFSQTASVGAEHSIAVETASDIDAEAEVILQSTPKTTAATAPSTAGTLEFLILPQSNSNVLYGEDRTLQRFSIRVTGKKDHLLDSITFTNDGSARDGDLQNLSIKGRDKERLSDVLPMLDGELATITFSTPLRLRRNETRVLTLNGDVTGSKRRTIDLTVQEPSDIAARAAGR